MRKIFYILLFCLLAIGSTVYALQMIHFPGVSTGIACSGTYGETDEQESVKYSGTTGRIYLGRVTFDCSGTIDKIYWWGKYGNVDTKEWRVVFYDDDGGSGEPGTKLYESSANRYTAGTSAVWYEEDVNISITAGDYYIGVHVEATGTYLYYTGTGVTRYYQSYALGSAPATWNAGSDTHTTVSMQFKVTF